MKYKNITIWHKTNQQYRRFLFKKAYVINKTKIKGAAAGELLENDISVRIFTPSDCGIAVGDRLYTGFMPSLSPPQNAFIITEVTPFFNASPNLKHYKIKCK